MLPRAMVSCRGGRTYGVELPRGLSATTQLYANAWLALLGDSPLGFKPLPTIHRFAADLAADYDGIAKRFSELADLLMRCVEYDSNGAVIFEADILLYKETPVFFEALRFKKQRNPEVLRYLLSFLNFGKRAPLVTPELADRALCAWKAVESRISDVKLTEETDDLAFVLDHLLSGFDHIPLPSHGGGRVATRGIQSPMEKHLDMVYNWPIDSVFFRWDRRFDHSDDAIPDASKGAWGMAFDVGRRRARLNFVYKTRFTMRSVCLEPPECQWGQQSVRISLERAIRESVAYRFIRLQDQAHNAEAAKAGSALGHLDTIDLSSASDSLGVQLVRKYFPRKVRKFLLATRSKGVELPDGTCVSVSKFAPMGSATCFPVQSLFYLAVALLCYYRWYTGGEAFSESRFRDMLRIINDDPWNCVDGLGALRVYGDDIVCDTRITIRIVDMLTKLGFIINSSKSFVSAQWFRESCGGYYFHGADVTPFSLKLPIVGNYLDPKIADGLLTASNRLHEVGYGNTRAYLLKVLHMWKLDGSDTVPHPLRYGSGGLDGDRWIGGFTRTRLYKPGSTRTESTCNRYQRDEERVLVTRTSSVTEGRDERYSYTRWMRSPRTADGAQALTAVGSSSHELKWAWLPI